MKKDGKLREVMIKGGFEAEKVRMEEITTWLKGDERNRYLETLKPA